MSFRGLNWRTCAKNHIAYISHYDLTLLAFVQVSCFTAHNDQYMNRLQTLNCKVYIVLFYNRYSWYTSGKTDSTTGTPIRWLGDGSNVTLETSQTWWITDADRRLNFPRIIYKINGMFTLSTVK